jgi:putative salt-induced outer membrane protein YdiY
MLLLFPLLTAHAADPSDSTFAAAPAGTEADKPVTTASIDAGATWTSGNTEAFTFSAAGRAAHMWEKNKLGLEILMNYGRSISDANDDLRLDEAERAAGFADDVAHYQADLRYDRFLSDTNTVYGLVGWYRDVFAGYDSRIHGQVGVAHYFVKNDTTEFTGELGFDVANEDYVEFISPPNDVIYAIREGLSVKHKFNEDVGIEEKLEAYESVEDFSDTRVLNTLALTSNVSGKLAVKLSHSLAFDNVPVENFEKLDQLAMASLVLTLL